MTTQPNSLATIPSADYLGLPATRRLKPTLEIEVAPRAYLPRLTDLQSDWVATIAVPAFKAIVAREGEQAAFCSIGTGVGLDALAAAEILNAQKIGITDVFSEVVVAAAQNIRQNLLAPESVGILAGHGDLLEPLKSTDGSHPRFDLIYENLPNIPLAEDADLTVARTSGSFLPPRKEPVPELLRRNLLALHYVALLQAKDFLTPGGSVLSMLGARVPLSVLLSLGQAAGLQAEIFAYAWKVQAEAEDVLRGHLAQQQAGFGPYHFYRAERLARAFEGVDFAESGAQALELEASLAADELDPQSALERWEKGERIGHTVAVLRSRLP
ncbi:MAG: hypothetical protein LBL69_00915 [Zoogloeaceae bacterium]|jgi:hypothetical protein|nr:hypothetical protein [Zoogloeaceae bacterium]